MHEVRRSERPSTLFAYWRSLAGKQQQPTGAVHKGPCAIQPNLRLPGLIPADDVRQRGWRQGSAFWETKKTLWHDSNQHEVLTSVNFHEGCFPAVTHTECCLISACARCTQEALEAKR